MAYLEAPPYTVKEFEFKWRNWLNNVYEQLRGPRWKVLTYAPFTGVLGSVTPPTLSSFGTGAYGREYEFNRGDLIYGEIKIPSDIVPNSQFYIDLHWSTDGTGTGNVEWVMAFALAKEGAIFPAATTLTVIDAANATAWYHSVSEVETAIDIEEPETVIIGNVMRGNTSDTYSDTAAGHVFLLSIGLHYQSDRFGTVNKDKDFYRRGN
jgi:hypothetical protein